MSTHTTTVGFVGLGAMGARMATNLLRDGHPVVVYNRTSSRSVALRELGAQVAETPREIVDEAGVICGCLLDGRAIEEVYLGREGMLGHCRAGQIFVEHATFAPSLARQLSSAANERGAEFLDAPVTGGPEAAAAGQLTAMVGGKTTAIDTVRPVLCCYVARLCHVGESGAGVALKLINQLLVSSHVAAAAEAVVLLRRLQLPVEVATEVLSAGWASSAMLTRTLARYDSDPTTPSEASIGGLLEPQRLALNLAAETGVDLTVFPAAVARFRDATEAGAGGRDVAALCSVLGPTGLGRPNGQDD